jgi:hypothetical protein
MSGVRARIQWRLGTVTLLFAVRREVGSYLPTG